MSKNIFTIVVWNIFFIYIDNTFKNHDKNHDFYSATAELETLILPLHSCLNNSALSILDF